MTAAVVLSLAGCGDIGEARGPTTTAATPATAKAASDTLSQELTAFFEDPDVVAVRKSFAQWGFPSELGPAFLAGADVLDRKRVGLSAEANQLIGDWAMATRRYGEALVRKLENPDDQTANDQLNADEVDRTFAAVMVAKNGEG